ncbi:15-hydroxyprostaglandin dehydrogenase [NAD(+)] [Dufourea novaeangliae]|uniref:15-hydroxyprostaglandin dehydrogenase [NAD(+)] n=1 Tax=Dufourea novaeangliae TaxID=178035 RepID=A0A154PC54_DUFNO|nr:15-hydroxyprostaglandin dehydrogenase [NAD(+)] [Dufourea novaeangliae]
MDHIKDKNVLITGAAGGIGLCYTQNLLKNGAKTVSILDLKTSPGQTTAANLEKEFGKGKATFYPCDVSNVKEFAETFKKAINTMNGVDIVINNAGVLNDLLWEQTVNVNIGAVIQGSLLAIEHMGKHKGGKGGILVNIASFLSLEYFSVCPVYCSSKHQVLAFSRCLEGNFERTGVRVLILCPGVTGTPMLLDVDKKAFEFIDKEGLMNFLGSSVPQSPDNCGKAMVTLIQKGENGAIWLSENDKPPVAIEIPPIKKMIAMIDIRESAGKQAMDTLNAEFGKNRAIFFQCDVANNSEFDDTFKKAVLTLGSLEILVNNAGVINESDFSQAINVNVTAVVRGTLLGIQQMQKDTGGKGGVIVNISSVAGLHALSQLPVYSATKHAVVSFSRSCAQPYHYQRTGVRIIVLCPEITQSSNDLPEGESLQKYHPQRVDSIAHGLVYVIRCAQNGSIWISEDGKPVYEIQLSDSLPLKPEEFSFNEI